MLNESQADYLIKFLVSDMPFNQRLKMYQQIKRMQSHFANHNANNEFPGIKALEALNMRYNPESELEYKPMTLAGRLANGAERDHGQIIHAVKGHSLCGAKPGRRSAGWVPPYPDNEPVNCEKCLKRIEALRNLTD